MPVDVSMYQNQTPPLNLLQAAGSAQSLSNSLQQNQLLKTANAQELLNLKNAQYQQQLGQLVTDHTGADGVHIAELAGDTNGNDNPYKGQLIQNLTLTAGKPSSYTSMKDGQVGTQYGSEQAVAASQLGTSGGKSPFQLRQEAIMANAPSDHQALFRNLQDGTNTLDSLMKKPQVSTKDVMNETVGLMQNGIVTPQQGAQTITGLAPTDGSDNVNKGQLLQAALPIVQNKNVLVNHHAQQQASQTNATPFVPTGYSSPLTTSRANYDQVTKDATDVPQKLAAYNEVINLNKAGAPTGTNIANMYQYLSKNIPGVAQGVTDKAVQAQEISKYLSQGLIAGGMPGSDARLQELQHANVNPDQLPETIKELTPFFKASAEGAVAKQAFYNKATNNGTDLSKEPQASQKWNQNYDPRWMEFDKLGDNGAKKEFLKKHPDMIDKESNLKNLQKMGVVGNQ